MHTDVRNLIAHHRSNYGSLAIAHAIAEVAFLPPTERSDATPDTVCDSPQLVAARYATKLASYPNSAEYWMDMEPDPGLIALQNHAAAELFGENIGGRFSPIDFEYRGEGYRETYNRVARKLGSQNGLEVLEHDEDTAYAVATLLGETQPGLIVVSGQALLFFPEIGLPFGIGASLTALIPGKLVPLVFATPAAEVVMPYIKSPVAELGSISKAADQIAITLTPIDPAGDYDEEKKIVVVFGENEPHAQNIVNRIVDTLQE